VLLASAYLKAAGRTLMKLTPGGDKLKNDDGIKRIFN